MRNVNEEQEEEEEWKVTKEEENEEEGDNFIQSISIRIGAAYHVINLSIVRATNQLCFSPRSGDNDKGKHFCTHFRGAPFSSLSVTFDWLLKKTLFFIVMRFGSTAQDKWGPKHMYVYRNLYLHTCVHANLCNVLFIYERIRKLPAMCRGEE